MIRSGPPQAQHVSDNEDLAPLRGALMNCRKALVWIGLFSLAINLLVLASPIYMLQVFDRVLSSGRQETLLFLTMIAGMAVLIMGLLEAVRARISLRIGGWLERRLAPAVLDSTLRARLVGQAVTAQPLRDLGTVRATLSSPALQAVVDMPWTPVFTLVIWILHPWLGAVALLAALVLFTVAVVNELISRKTLQQAGKHSIRATQVVDAGLRNAEAVRAMGMLPALRRRHAEVNGQGVALQQQAGDWNATLMGLSKFLRLFVQILILGVGAMLVLRGEITAGGMIAGSILLSRALAPIEYSISAWKQLVSARDAWRRVVILLESMPAEPKGMSLPTPNGQLACMGIVFVAPFREEPILKGISFNIEAGEALGIIGPSAAGKSTLCKMLVGAWKPTRGHARLDSADIYAWNSEQLGPYIGYLPQDVELFAGTVQENIGRLDPDPDPKQVVEAAKVAGVHEMVLRLPQGYDTQIGEAGTFLSGGQRQRIGLARAVFGRPKLIVLDEPSASLDTLGEEALVKAIGTAKQWGASVVLVAHHPSILRTVDKLLVMREGTVKAFGLRDEILGKLRVASTGTNTTAPIEPGTIPSASARRTKAE